MATINRVLGNVLVFAALLLGSVGPSLGAEPGPGFDAWGVLTPTVALAPDGNPWVAWAADSGEDWEILASRWNGQSWEPPDLVYANPGRWDASPSLAFDAQGTAWLAWSSSTGTDDSLHLSRWTKGGWSEPQEMPFEHTRPNRQPVLAPAPGGGLWLAWVGFDGNDDEI